MKREEIYTYEPFPETYAHLCLREYPCPYCGDTHPAKEVESDYEDTFFIYMDCPEVGEVRVTFEFQDHFIRFEKQ